MTNTKSSFKIGKNNKTSNEGVVARKRGNVNIMTYNSLACLKERDSCIAIMLYMESLFLPSTAITFELLYSVFCY